jgi:hypothetical protein
MRWLVLFVVACGHDGPSVPAPSGSAAEHLNAALAAEGIHQRGDTPVDTASIDAFARSFVAVLSSGDQRAAISLLENTVWDSSCAADASRPAAEKLGGLLVSVPRNIAFASAAPIGAPHTIGKGQRLAGCPVTADAIVSVVHVAWTGPAGNATLELARPANGAWTLTAISD